MGDPRRVDQLAEVARGVYTRSRDVRATGLAAEVAFFAVLSVFPAIVAVASGVGSLDTLVGRDLASTVEAEVVDFLNRVLTQEAEGTISAVQDLFTARRTGIVTVSMAAAVWAASRGFVAVIRAMDVVYGIQERRSYVRLRVIAIALALGSVLMAVVVLAMIVVGPLLGTGQEVADAIGMGGAFATAWDWIRWPVAAAALLLWASAMMRVAPNRNERWTRDLTGAAVAASTWAVSTVALNLYLRWAGQANQVLGALGGPLIVLVWLYLLALGLLLGAACNHVLAARRERATDST